MENSRDSKSLITIKFNNHVLVDEKSPFVLYSISLTTMYSKVRINKRYSNFVAFNKELLKYSNDEILMWNGRFEMIRNLIPVFPDSSLYLWNLDEEFIQTRKTELQSYSQALIDMFFKLTMKRNKIQENARKFQPTQTKSKIN